MNEGQIARALSAGNVWWRDPDWERGDRDLRALSATRLHYEPAPLAGIAPDGLYVLRGPRRVGKSVETKRAISRLISDGVAPRRLLHFACDALGRGDLRRLANVGREVLTRGIGEPRYWFLDEITSVPGWPEDIKWLRDNTSFGDDCVVLTGSSARDLSDAQKALAGRRGRAPDPDRLLLPMGFRSFARAIGIDGPPALEPVAPNDFLGPASRDALSGLLPWLDELLSAWELYLQVGGFPRAVADQLETAGVSDRLIGELWDVTAGEAIRGAATSPGQVLAMLDRLARSLTTTLAISSLREDLDVDSPHTAKARLSDLVFAYLVWPCHRRAELTPKLSAQSKFYFTDPLLARLASLKSDGRLDEPDTAALSEQQLGLELVRCLERARPGSYSSFSDVMYRRTTTKEVDFAGPQIDPLAFESKYVDAGLARESLTLRRVYGRGVVATRGVFDIAGDVWFVPAPFVAWLLNA